MHQNLGSHLLLLLALFAPTAQAEADRIAESLHSPSAQLKIHFEARHADALQHLVVQLETDLGLIDISENVLHPIRCKDQSLQAEILSVAEPKLHHRHFSFQAEWRCGELLYHAKVGMGLDPQTVKGPFQIAPHLFSVSQSNSCTSSLSSTP